MKAVMISVAPKMCEKVASGDCTILVRKTSPNIDMPFKCYIYATKPKKWFRFSSFGLTSNELLWLSCGKVKMSDGFEFWADGNEYELLCGKVIGEFVCNRIDDYSQWEFDYYSLLRHIELFSKAGYEFLDKYLKGQKKGYGWHISDLVIYDKPKELGEFYSTRWDMPCENKKRGFSMDFCMVYPDGSYFCKELNCDKKRLTSPPKSWQYVEEKENEDE